MTAKARTKRISTTLVGIVSVLIVTACSPSATSPPSSSPATNHVIPTDSPQTDNWETKKLKHLGITYKQPPQLAEFSCDQSSCLSSTTTLPNGTTFTEYIAGPDTTSGPGDWQFFLDNYRSVGLTVTEMQFKNRPSATITGILDEPSVIITGLYPSINPLGGEQIQLEGKVVKPVPNQATTFISWMIYTDKPNSRSFGKDRTIFHRMLETMDFSQ